MSYSCLEELQTILDLHVSDKTFVLSDAGCKCNNGWFVVTDDGHCHLFGKDGNLDDIKKIKHLEEKYIRKDIKKIIIPDTVIRIESDAFFKCSGLTNVTIPDSVTNIGNWAFEGCSGLTSVTIPGSVTSIGGCAFESCSGLTSVTIPDNVMNIGKWAFDNCNNLKSLVFKGKTLNQVKKMKDYPWGIKDESIIKCIE